MKAFPAPLKNLPLALYYLAVAALLSLAARSAVWNIGSDGISYISIAEHYAGGHFKEAVNAYWSPVLSWLLTPFVALGVDGETTYRIIVVICAMSILIVGQKLVSRYAKDKWLAYAVYHLSMLTLLLYAVKNFITPDLLVVLWMVLLAFMLSKTDTPIGQSKKWLISLGTLGGIGYLTKAILLPVFILSLVIWFLFLSRAPRGVRLADRAKQLTLPLLALAIVVLIWVVPLSIKYKGITLGSSGKYSISFVGPNTIGHPVTNGLLPPPNNLAVTPWEDPTNHPYVRWSPFDSINDFGFYLDLVLTNNIRDVLSALGQLSPFLVGSFWAILIFLILGKVDRRHRRPLMIACLLSGVLVLAYCASHIRGGGRYLWPVFALSTVSISILLGSWQTYTSRMRLRGAFWLASLAIPLLIFLNWYGLLFPVKKDQYFPLPQQLYREIKEKVPPRARFASNSFGISVMVSYYTDLTGYGTTQPGLSLNDPLVQKALKQNGVEYYLFIENSDQPVNLSGFRPILTTNLEFSDPPIGLPPGNHKVYLIKLE